jgi:hypothetical protein
LKYGYVLFSFSKSIMEGRKGLVLIYYSHCSFMLMALWIFVIALKYA